MEQIVIKNRISSISDASDVLNAIEIVATSPMKKLIESQVAVLKYVQSATLFDSLFTSLVANFEQALKMTINQSEKEQLTVNFHNVIHNYVFFLDAKMQFELDKNSEIGKQLLESASGLLCLTTRDIIRMTLHTVVASGKVRLAEQVTENVMEFISDVNRDAMWHIDSMHDTACFQLANASEIVTTTITETQTVIEEKGITPENANIISDLSKTSQSAIERIYDKSLDRFEEVQDKRYDRSSAAIDSAHQAIDNILIEDLFGKDRLDETREFCRIFYDWWHKGKRDKKQKDDFYGSLRLLFIKFNDYQMLFGKSIIISDMIKRYIPSISEHFAPKSPSKVYNLVIFVTLALELIIGLFVGLVRFVYYSNEGNSVPENWFGNQTLITVLVLLISAIFLFIPWYKYMIAIKKFNQELKGYRILSEQYNPYC